MTTAVDLTLTPRLTAWGVAWLASVWGNVAPTRIAGDSMNDHFGVFSGDLPANGATGALEYFGFGYGSTYAVTTGNGASVNKSYVHEPYDAGLYYPVPMIARPVGHDDLTTHERASYAMRKVYNRNGVDTAFYFLKAIDRTTAAVAIDYVVPPTGSNPEQRTTLKADPKYGAPVPMNPSKGTAITNGAYIDVSLPLRTVLTSTEVGEVLSAYTLLTGNVNLEITEISLVCANPEDRTFSDGAKTVTYTEAIAATMHSSAPVRVLLNQLHSTGFSTIHNVGLATATNCQFINTP